MSARTPGAPPAGPRVAHAQVERIAYRKLIRGEITAEQYRDAIAPPRRARRWRLARR